MADAVKISRTRDGISEREYRRLTEDLEPHLLTYEEVKGGERVQVRTSRDVGRFFGDVENARQAVGLGESLFIARSGKGYRELFPEEQLLTEEDRLALGAVVKHMRRGEDVLREDLGIDESGSPYLRAFRDTLSSGRLSTLQERIDKGDANFAANMSDIVCNYSEGAKAHERALLKRIDRMALERMGSAYEDPQISSPLLRGLVSKYGGSEYIERAYGRVAPEQKEGLIASFMGKEGSEIEQRVDEATEYVREGMRGARTERGLVQWEHELMAEGAQQLTSYVAARCGRATRAFRESGQFHEYLDGFCDLRQILLLDDSMTAKPEGEDALKWYMQRRHELGWDRVTDDPHAQKNIARVAMVLNEGLKRGDEAEKVAEFMRPRLLSLAGEDFKSSEWDYSFDLIAEDPLTFVKMCRAWKTRQ